MSRTARLARALIFAYGYQLTVMLVGLWLTPILLGRLGTDLYGQWLIFGQILGLLGLLDLGVTSILMREVAVAAGGGDPNRGIAAVVRRATWLVWLQTPLVGLVAVIVWIVLTLRSPELSVPLAIIMSGFAVLFPLRVFGSVLGGLQDLMFGAWAQAAAWTTTTVLSLGLVFAGQGLSALAIGWAAGQGVSATLCYYRLRNKFPTALTWPGWPGRSELWVQLRPSLWGSVYQFASILSTGTDLLVLGWVLGPEAVVLYSCTVKLPAIALHPLSAIMTTAFPALAELRAGDDRARYWRAVHAVGLTLLMVSGAVVIGLTAANAAFVAHWVGSDRFAGPFVSILGVVLLLARHYALSLTGPSYTLGRERRLAFILMAEGIVSITATAVWTTAVGLIGIPIGIITALGLVTVPLSITIISQEAGISPSRVVWWIVPWFVRFATVFIPIGIATFIVPVDSIWVAAGLAFIGLSIYAAAVVQLFGREPLLAYNPLRAIRQRFRAVE